jgi:hypothetical protein
MLTVTNTDGLGKTMDEMVRILVIVIGLPVAIVVAILVLLLYKNNKKKHEKARRAEDVRRRSDEQIKEKLQIGRDYDLKGTIEFNDGRKVPFHVSRFDDNSNRRSEYLFFSDIWAKNIDMPHGYEDDSVGIDTKIARINALVDSSSAFEEKKPEPVLLDKTELNSQPSISIFLPSGFYISDEKGTGSVEMAPWKEETIKKYSGNFQKFLRGLRQITVGSRERYIVTYPDYIEGRKIRMIRFQVVVHAWPTDSDLSNNEVLDTTPKCPQCNFEVSRENCAVFWEYKPDLYAAEPDTVNALDALYQVSETRRQEFVRSNSFLAFTTDEAEKLIVLNDDDMRTNSMYLTFVPLPPLGSQKKVGIAIPNRSDHIQSIGIACPHCCHILPDGFFDLPLIYIGLYGGSSSGKTTAVAFLLKKIRDAGENLWVGKICLKWFSILDRSYIYYKKIVSDLHSNMLPEGTALSLKVPPVWLKLLVNKGQGEQETALVAVRDIAGEAITSSNIYDMATAYLRNSQGVICLDGADSLFHVQSSNADTPPVLLGISDVKRIQTSDTSLIEDPIRHYDFSDLQELSAGSGTDRNSMPLDLGSLNAEIRLKMARLRSVSMTVSKADMIPSSETLSRARSLLQEGRKDNLFTDFFYHMSDIVGEEVRKKPSDDLWELVGRARSSDCATDLSFHLVSVLPNKVFHMTEATWKRDVLGDKWITDSQIDEIAKNEDAYYREKNVTPENDDRRYFFGFPAGDAAEKRLGLERPLAWIVLNHWQRTHRGKMPWE